MPAKKLVSKSCVHLFSCFSLCANTGCTPSRYLALVAALACEADWVFIPEWPPEANWQDALCDKLAQVRRPDINST